VAPRDTLELQLVQIWERILEVRPIGVRDNFFELGGHSLLAVRRYRTCRWPEVPTCGRSDQRL
jgi:hypothetical protein